MLSCLECSQTSYIDDSLHAQPYIQVLRPHSMHVIGRGTRVSRAPQIMAKMRGEVQHKCGMVGMRLMMAAWGCDSVPAGK